MTPSTIRPAEWLRRLLPLLFWLAVWQLGAMAVELAVESRGHELLLPYPATVGGSLIRLAGTADFWKSILASLLRILWGLCWGTAAGVLLALLTHFSLWCDTLLSPAIRVIRATPVVSFILLVLLWVGRNTVPAVIAGLMVLPVIWGGTVQGLEQTDAKLLELARAYRFSRWKVLRLIYLPSLRPAFLTALTTSMGLAWKSGVAAEVLCLPPLAMGTHIQNAKLYLEVPDLFAWTGTAILLSLLLEALVRRLLQGKGADA